MDNNLNTLGQAENKRPKLKAGAVMSLISHILYLLYSLVLSYFMYIIVSLTYAFANAGDGAGAEVLIALILAIVPFIIRCILSIVGIVFSAKTLKIANLNPEEYAKKKKSATVLMIFNVILLCVGIYSISGLDFTEVQLVSIIIFFFEIILYVLFVTSTALIAIQVNKDKQKKTVNASAQTQKAEQTVPQENCEPCETTDGQVVAAHADHPVKDTSIVNKVEELERIENLKKQGLITADEYKEMIKKLDEQ